MCKRGFKMFFQQFFFFFTFWVCVCGWYFKSYKYVLFNKTYAFRIGCLYWFVIVMRNVFFFFLKSWIWNYKCSFLLLLSFKLFLLSTLWNIFLFATLFLYIIYILVAPFLSQLKMKEVRRALCVYNEFDSIHLIWNSRKAFTWRKLVSWFPVSNNFLAVSNPQNVSNPFENGFLL